MKRIVVLLSGIIVLATTSVYSQNKIFMAGMAAFDKKEYEKSIQLLEQVINQKEANIPALKICADSWYMLGEIDSALYHYQRIEKAKPGMASYDLSRCYAKTGNIENSIYYLRNNLESAYKVSESVILLEAAFQQIENTREWKNLWAREWYNKAEKLVQEFTYLVESGDYMEAIDRISSSLINFPKRDELYALRAKAYDKSGNLKNALSDYDKAISLNKRNSGYYEARAMVYGELKKYGRSIEDLDRAVKLKPEHFELYLERAEISKLSGNFEQAISDIELYRSYFPENEPALFEAGNIYYESGQYEHSLILFNQLVADYPAKPEYFLGRGLTNFELHKLENAIYDFSQSLDLNPKLAESWYNKGLVRYYSGDTKGACNDWKKAVELGHPKAAEQLGMYCR
jgi:tetratricopeptide (TPR) repeat protein